MLGNITKGAAIAACISLASFATPAFAQDYEMTFAITAPVSENAFSYTPFEVFAKEVEGRSAGRIAVSFFPGSQLGNVESTINQTKDGVIQASATSDGAIASIFPEMQVASIPYVFPGREIAWEVMDGAFGDQLSDLMAEKTGLRPIGWYENGGYRHYSSADREMKTLDDLAGLKMRTMQHPLHMEIATSLGMSPTPIPWGELYTSLQTGVVDGQENAIPTFLVPNLQEVQNYIILDGHVYAMSTVVVNETWYQGLPDDLKAVLDQAAEVAVWTSRGLSVSNEIAGRTLLESEGVTINDVPAVEKARFADATQPKAVEWLRTQIDGALVDDILAAVEEAKGKFGY